MDSNFSSPMMDLSLTESIALGTLLSSFSLITIIGNVMIACAVATKTYLQTPTGFLIVSLSVADLIVGTFVMPLNTMLVLTKEDWVFGLIFCDIWRSIDVLASTASIWNLCVISLDRYLAIKDPLNYRDIVTTRRVALAIGLTWAASAVLSFPAIAWWRTTSTPQIYGNERKCQFTDDVGYIVFSSLVSFYIPLFITLFAYWRIFCKAMQHERSIQSGRKRVKQSRCSKTPSNSDSQPVYIRIHRGGAGTAKGTQSIKSTIKKKSTMTLDSAFLAPESASNGWNRSSERSTYSTSPARKISSPIPQFNEPGTPGSSGSFRRTFSQISQSSRLSVIESPQAETASLLWQPRKESADTNITEQITENTPSIPESQKKISMNWEPSQNPQTPRTLRRKITKASLLVKFVAEKRAAKTLGLVVGCFVICWFPFFLVNILIVSCQSCIKSENEALVFVIVTWLGHCNSFLNPIIYTCFNRDFRKAFKQMIFQRRRDTTFTARSGLSRAIEGSLSLAFASFGKANPP